MEFASGSRKMDADGPEVDNLDGYAFISFEHEDEMNSYGAKSYVRKVSKRVPVDGLPSAIGKLPSGVSLGKISGKAAVGASGNLLANQLSKNGKKGGQDGGARPRGPNVKARGGAKPILAPQKSRLRKSDKRAITDKLGGFVFVSALTLDDLNNYVPPVNSGGGEGGNSRKRKAEAEPLGSDLPLALRKAKKKSTKKCHPGNVVSHPEASISSPQDLNEKPTGGSAPRKRKRKTNNDPGATNNKYGGKVESHIERFLSSLGISDLNDQKELSHLISSTNTISHGDLLSPTTSATIEPSTTIPPTNTINEYNPDDLQKRPKLTTDVDAKNEDSRGGTETTPNGELEPKGVSEFPNLDLDKLFKRLKARRQLAAKKERQEKELAQKLVSKTSSDKKNPGKPKKMSLAAQSRSKKKKTLSNTKTNRAKCGDIISSDDSDTLDVCGIDDIVPSTEFIRNNINKPDPEVLELQMKAPNQDKPKPKKKKCRTCCEHPCKITEAKRVSSLWGSSFPSYSASCVYTCRVHLPGEIHQYQNETKFGFIDTCIQTTAPDIEMHYNFAERFPHKVIAVEIQKAQPPTLPPDQLIMIKPGNSYTKRDAEKSEHHRSSEQKRREQMHFAFVDLRKAVCVSQAISDKDRASKQWILEEAIKVIGSLKIESMLLTTLKQSLLVKQEKLAKRWSELSGKKFHPKVAKEDAKDVSQSKLMDLYKQYRKDVQKGKPTSTTVTPSLGNNEQKALDSPVEEMPESNNSAPNLTNPDEPVVISDDEKDVTHKNLNLTTPSSIDTQELYTGSTVPATQPIRETKMPGNKFTRAGIKNNLAYQPQTTNKYNKAIVSQRPQTTASEVGSVNTAVVNPTNMVKPATAIKTTNSMMANSEEMNLPPKLNQPFHLLVTSCPGNPSLDYPTKIIPVPNPGRTPPNILKPFIMRVPHTNTPNTSLQVVNKIVSLPLHDVTPNIPNQSNVSLGKPNQWTTVGTMPVKAKKNPIEDVGAVEVVETKSDHESSLLDPSEKIVLLDVTEAQKKSPERSSSSSERTISLVPTSSSISVTLNSVGSITSNKINNKKALPTSFTDTMFKTPTCTSAPVANVPKPVDMMVNTTTSKTDSFNSQSVPNISDALLEDTGSTDGSGLCIISNVFSLSDSPPKPTQDGPDKKHADNIQLIKNVIEEHCPSHNEQSKSCLTHDHNYYKSDLENNMKICTIQLH